MHAHNKNITYAVTQEIR